MPRRFGQPCRSLDVHDPTHGSLGRPRPARLVRRGRERHSRAFRCACDAPAHSNKSFQSPRRVRPLEDQYRAMHFALTSKGSPNRRSPFFLAADCPRQPHRLHDSQHPSDHHQRHLRRGRERSRYRRFSRAGKAGKNDKHRSPLDRTIAIDTLMDQCPV
jgi:hypothetical protein